MAASYRVYLCLFILTISTACMSTQSKAVVEFPTPQALALIEAKVVKMPARKVGSVPKEGWVVDTNLPAKSVLQPWQPDSPWGLAFTAAVAGSQRPLRLTAAMACVAHELGRYRLEFDAAPPPGLKKFIIGACGSVVPQVSVRVFGGEASEDMSEAQLLQAWRSKIESELLAQLPSSVSEAGFWFGRREGKALAMVAYNQAQVELKTQVLEPNDRGELVLEGRLDDEVDYFGGYINQGRFGVQSCLVDLGVARPQFRIVCAMAQEDRTAWVQLVYAQPKRVLAVPFLQLLVRRTLSEPLMFAETRPAEPESAVTPQEFARTVLEKLNTVRAQAELQPVKLSVAQSELATSLSGHFFAESLEQGSSQDADLIALGLLAGHRISGMIRNGRFLANWMPVTHNADLWLDAALDTPIGRTTLLSAEIEEIAIGPTLLAGSEGVGTLVTGYQLYHGNDHSQDVIRLYLRVAFARQRLGLSPPKRLGGMTKILNQELMKVNAGQLSPNDALDTALTEGVFRFGTDMHGCVFESTSLDALQIPEAVLNQPKLHMAIGVTHHKPPGAAWAQFAILVMFISYEGREENRTP